MRCFAPQQRALFRHVNFQTLSETKCFVYFDCDMCFAPERHALFRHGNFQKVLREWEWCALHFLTSKCASRHNGVQFFISHLARWLRTGRFSEATSRPSGATNHLKNTVNHDFSTFSRTCIFFLLTLSLLWSSLFFSSLLWSSFFFSFLLWLFPPLLFDLSILSEVWLLNSLR